MEQKTKKEAVNKRFAKNEDGTITDRELGLTWLETLPKKMTWKEAKEECEKLGARLPTVKELFSLVDHSRYSPAIDKDIFTDIKTDDWYWTGTEVADWPDCAWIVYFSYGNVYYAHKGGSYYVRPVRPSK